MAVLALLTLALLAGSACSAPQASRIAGGTETSIENYPSIVSVESFTIWSAGWGQSCAASILTTRYVLSAAHCFTGRLFSIRTRRFRAGSTYGHTDGVIVYAEEAINHPDFELVPAPDADISVIRLETPLVFSSTIQQGSIVAQGFSIPENLPVIHVGWGVETETGPLSEVLKEVTLFTISRDVCAARYQSLENPLQITENMLCTGVLDVDGIGACVGDAGGPVYYDNIIVGVYSWSWTCGDGTYPSVSTSVASYTDWIVATAV